MDPSAEIKKIYYAATKATIQKDLEHALDLLKTIPLEEDRDRVAVYIHGLTEMRSEWRAIGRAPAPPKGKAKNASASPRPPASGRRPAAPPARSDRSKSSSRRTR